MASAVFWKSSFQISRRVMSSKPQLSSGNSAVLSDNSLILISKCYGDPPKTF